MKKRFIYQVMFLVILLCALSLAIVPSASAHQTANSPKHSLTPNASGGGCSQGISSQRNDIQNLKSCISYNYPQLLPDAYVTFRPSNKFSGLSSCKVTIYLYDFDTDQEVTSGSYNCIVDAANKATNKHYGPFVYNDTAGTYYSFSEVTLVYTGGTRSIAISNDSPVQNIP